MKRWTINLAWLSLGMSITLTAICIEISPILCIPFGVSSIFFAYTLYLWRGK